MKRNTTTRDRNNNSVSFKKTQAIHVLPIICSKNTIGKTYSNDSGMLVVLYIPSKEKYILFDRKLYTF